MKKILKSGSSVFNILIVTLLHKCSIIYLLQIIFGDIFRPQIGKNILLLRVSGYPVLIATYEKIPYNYAT